MDVEAVDDMKIDATVEYSAFDEKSFGFVMPHLELKFEIAFVVEVVVIVVAVVSKIGHRLKTKKSIKIQISGLCVYKNKFYVCYLLLYFSSGFKIRFCFLEFV